MVPACLISERTNMRNILCAAAVMYDDQERVRTSPLFFQFPSDDQVSGRRILVVDDVWDTGGTIVAVRDRLRRACGSSRASENRSGASPEWSSRARSRRWGPR